MALIALVTYDTPENQRGPMTWETLVSLRKTVDFGIHRLFVVDNGSTDGRTLDVLRGLQEGLHSIKGVFVPPATIIRNAHNIGTAMAINLAWKSRRIDEVAVKMDNDVVIHQDGWLDTIEEVFRRDPLIGICGLKRKDLEERPNHPNPWYISTLRMLPHEPGQSWLVVESCNHIMGTCQAYSAGLLNTIGYLYQGQDEGNLYGFDDSLASFRAHLAHFDTVFLPSIDIDHIDPGGTTHTADKQATAGRWMARYNEIKAEYQAGTRPLWWEDK